MNELNALKQRIRQAFADVPYPGDGQLVAHANYGDEHTLTKEAFRGRDNWQTLEWAFLDDAPGGWGNALHFFTPAAFRFYLPAYLLADLETPFQRASLTISLWFGLTEVDQAKPMSRKTRKEARDRGGQTNFELRSQRFVDFTPAQAEAVVAYLRYILYVRDLSESERQQITEAAQCYWLPASIPSD